MLFLVALTVGGAASAQDIRATVDGTYVNFPDVQPRMTSTGHVMVPVRGVFEHMNATVVWDNASQTVVAERGADSIRLPVNSNTATINGRQVSMSTPATNYQGRTMVPLRFLSEALGASVKWLWESRTVQIQSGNGPSNTTPPVAGYTLMQVDSGTVIPFKLSQRLSSDASSVGDKFTATLDTAGSSNYQGITNGAILEGHVEVTRAKSGDTPGVLGLAFDRIRMADGQTYAIAGALIGLDEKSITNENGRLVAKPGSKNDSLKYVGIGAGGGAIVALLTKGNVVTNSLIGAALGFVLGEIQKDPSKARNVNLESGTGFGVRLTRDLTFQVPTAGRTAQPS
ncbi:MAG: copper amine oxidase N-terminal domain-containing protein [Fimbriimonadaceae bacterium]|nr:copper amine oxidase N-terminal domain-containing protein [Fimbriimonadaceae bacterium]